MASKNTRIARGNIGGRFALLLIFCVLGTSVAIAAGPSEKALWQQFRAGTVFAMMRHAIAPGTGDPERFAINDCSTQRNLSEKGREQARTAGKMFRKRGFTNVAVYSSQWCRCRETAELLAIGPVNDLTSLNSFFEAYERRDDQTRKLKSWLKTREARGPLLLVTHQVNISALTGVGTRSGEILFVKETAGGTYQVLGSIRP